MDDKVITSTIITYLSAVLFVSLLSHEGDTEWTMPSSSQRTYGPKAEAYQWASIPGKYVPGISLSIL